MGNLLTQFFAQPTQQSTEFSEEQLLLIIQSGRIFDGYVRLIDKVTGYTTAFEFVYLYYDNDSNRIRGISGFSVYDENEGKYIEGSCASSSFKRKNQSLLLFSDNRYGSKYQKQLLAQKLIHPPTQKRKVYCDTEFNRVFKKYKSKLVK